MHLFQFNEIKALRFQVNVLFIKFVIFQILFLRLASAIQKLLVRLGPFSSFYSIFVQKFIFDVDPLKCNNQGYQRS